MAETGYPSRPYVNQPCFEKSGGKFDGAAGGRGGAPLGNAHYTVLRRISMSPCPCAAKLPSAFRYATSPACAPAIHARTPASCLCVMTSPPHISFIHSRRSADVLKAHPASAQGAIVRQLKRQSFMALSVCLSDGRFGLDSDTTRIFSWYGRGGGRGAGAEPRLYTSHEF